MDRLGQLCTLVVPTNVNLSWVGASQATAQHGLYKGQLLYFIFFLLSLNPIKVSKPATNES